MRQLPDPELTPDEITTLTRIRDSDRRMMVRKRAQIVLLTFKIYEGKEISVILDVSPDTVTDVLRRWKETRIEGITKQQGKLTPAKVTKCTWNQ